MESRVYYSKSGTDKTKTSFNPPYLSVISLDTFHSSTQFVLNPTACRVLC